MNALSGWLFGIAAVLIIWWIGWQIFGWAVCQWAVCK